MINPYNITNYNLSYDELEEHLLFWVCAAGKNSLVAARSLEKLLSAITYNNRSPFESIREVVITNEPMPLSHLLRWAGIGCYNIKAKTFKHISESSIDLKKCSVEELEQIYGIGMKTSRCFILHSRINSKHAALDTHILKHLRVMGVKNVPVSTPSTKKQYLRLEQEFLKLAEKAEISPAEYDLKIWKKYAVKAT